MLTTDEEEVEGITDKGERGGRRRDIGWNVPNKQSAVLMTGSKQDTEQRAFLSITGRIYKKQKEARAMSTGVGQLSIFTFTVFVEDDFSPFFLKFSVLVFLKSTLFSHNQLFFHWPCV